MLHSRLSFQEIISDGEKQPPVGVGEPLLGSVWVPMLCIMCPCVLARAKTRSVDMHTATLWCHGNVIRRASEHQTLSAASYHCPGSLDSDVILCKWASTGRQACTAGPEKSP
ncbi:hypothetical protein JOQ06_012391, partial [Pogonophryne albipinna]